MVHPEAAAMSVFLNFIALTWVVDLEKYGCPCVRDWRRRVLKYWYLFAIVWPLILLLISPIPGLVMGLTAAAGVFSLVAFYALVRSLWEIERQKCQCAQDWRERVLLLTTSLSIVAFVILALTRK